MRGLTIVRPRVLSAVLLLLSGLASASTAEPVRVPEPTSTRLEANLTRITSTAGTVYTVARYALPQRGSVPHILAIDREDYVWFSESGGRFAKNFIDAPAANRIGRIDREGTVSEWTIAAEETSPMGIVFDAAGALWITERLADRVTRMNPDGTLTRYDVPTKASWPTGIAIGGDGKVWFTETRGDKVGVIDPTTGQVREYEVPTPASATTGIAVDHAGKVWIAQRDANIIGRLDPDTGTFDQFPLPTPDAKPCGIAVAPDGTVWFSERNGGKLGTIGQDGAVREYALKDRTTGPFLLAIDQSGGVWFSEIFGNRIGRFDSKKASFEHFAVAEGHFYPAGIALDSKGNVWFAEQASDHIGVIVRTDLAYLDNKGTASDADDANIVVSRDFDLEEFSIPTPNSIPGILGIDSRGTVWFTEMGGGFVGPGFPPGPPGSKIGYVEDGVLSEIALPTPESGPTSLDVDPVTDDLWVSLRSANKIARVRDKTVEEFDIPVVDSEPIGIAVDRRSNIWVALSRAGMIARRTPGGVWALYNLPDKRSNPRTIFIDRNDRVWFSEKDGNHLGEIDPVNGTVKRWQIPTRMAWPLSILDDADGKIWFAEMRSDKLGTFDPATETFAEYDLPVQSAPFKLHYDEASASIWISTIFANAVLRFDIEKKRTVTAYKIPNEGVWLGGIARDKDGCFWVTEQFGNQVDRMCIAGLKGVRFGQVDVGR
ncbi:hypothetical protein [Sinorhizobium meliloti]|uniref:Vgb family protein n=1 Tax=Rhizobium meliloti TaxID=382 RepID=UPI00299CDDED|nr:hypothetical protein [Sinorhizobium meliloti]